MHPGITASGWLHRGRRGSPEGGGGGCGIDSKKLISPSLTSVQAVMRREVRTSHGRPQPASVFLLPGGAPSRIRTCAHGSGGGALHLSNSCTLPARTRSLTCLAATIIPRIFRIMETSPFLPAPCRGWPASGPGRLRPGPWFLTGVSAVAPGSSATSRVRWPVPFHLCWLALRAQSRLRLEGRARTLSGPSPDLTSSVSGLSFRGHPGPRGRRQIVAGSLSQQRRCKSTS
jgi:hypothetical protein